MVLEVVTQSPCFLDTQNEWLELNILGDETSHG